MLRDDLHFIRADGREGLSTIHAGKKVKVRWDEYLGSGLATDGNTWVSTITPSKGQQIFKGWPSEWTDWRQNPKSRKGPIGETLGMIDGVSSYITKPLHKAGQYMDRGIGQMIGKRNPPIRGDEKVAAAARSLGYSYKWNGEEWELRRLSDGRLVKASTDRVTIGEAMREDYFKTHRVNPDYDDLKYDRERVVRMSDSGLIREYNDMERASSGIFGGNAKRVGNLIVDELTRRGIDSIPSIFGSSKVKRFNPHRYEIRVQGLGAVWSGENEREAQSKWSSAVQTSYDETRTHKYSDKGVTLYKDGEVLEDYTPDNKNTNPSSKTEKFSREAEAKAYKRLVEAEGLKAKVEFEPDLKGEKWVVRVTDKSSNKRKNPEDEAAEMYESFTGAPSEVVDEYEIQERFHSWLAKGGDLLGLKVRTLSGYDATLEFKNVVMGLNEAGTQIYPTGSGDQKLDLKKLHMDELSGKDSLIVGWVWAINYRASKDFDGFDTEMQYVHVFGDEKLHQKMSKQDDLWEDAKPPKDEAFESGELPMLRYSCLNKSISIEGGMYKIDKPWMETSPGIEG